MAEQSPRLRILLLDDSEVQLTNAARALSVAGHQVRSATSVSEAAAMVSGVDLVIVDFHMPGLDGASALPILSRHVPRGEVVLFYLYTNDVDVARRFKELEFDGAFTSKGDVDVLVRQVEAARRIIKLKRFRKERAAG
jgi:CheY-like chemotaxis protein